MKNEIFYCNRIRQDRSLTNLCSSNPTHGVGLKQKFYIIPDRKMSFLKILDLPSAPENKLRDMVRFQILKIYPGNTEDTSFDFISFKIGTGWKIVLYILKKKYIDKVSGNENFCGIVLPLQLLSMNELQSLSNLIIFYPGMVEVWKLAGGVPERVERYDPEEFSIQNLIISKNESLGLGKLMAIYPYNEINKREQKNIRIKKFSETLDSLSRRAVCFPEYKAISRDRITAPIVITALILSLTILGLTILKYQEFIGKEEEVNTWIKSIQLAAEQNRSAMEVIGNLEDELRQIRGNIPVNVYNLLLRTRKAVDSNTDVLSFGLKGMEFSLILNSKNALSNLEGLKAEFGNVRASNIRTLDNGLESYSVRVEINQ